MAIGNPFSVDTFIRASGGGARNNYFAFIPGVVPNSVESEIRQLAQLVPAIGVATRVADTVKGFADNINRVFGSAGASKAERMTPDVPKFYHSVLCKSVPWPGRTIKNIGPMVRGRETNIPGATTWGDFKVTMYCTPNHSTRGYYEYWMNLINQDTENLRPANGLTYSDLYRDSLLLQLNSAGKPLAGIYLHGAWPAEMGEMATDVNGDEMLTFDTKFAYQGWSRIPTSSFTGIGATAGALADLGGSIASAISGSGENTRLDF